jgi:predicted RNase H-like HicB family nuclease
MAVTTKKGPGAVGEIAFTVQVFREGKMFVAHAPELDVSSAGETVQKAKIHLLEAVEAFVEEAQRMGTLTDILEEAGYERTPAGWKAPDLLAQERAKVALPS